MTPCVEWTGRRDKKGYGHTWFRGKPERAHRVAWIKERGPIPPGMCVCHTCDNPACVRADHLFLGTNNDNVQDKVRKGRQYRKPSRLTPEQVLRIKQAQRGEIRRVAREIGIHHTYALEIRRKGGKCTSAR